MGRITDTVKVLVIINIIFYVGSLLVGEEAYRLFVIWFPENENFQIWQLVTHMFMHSATIPTHILFNMFMLYMFGSTLENTIGKNKFLFLYFSAGIGSVGIQILFAYWQYIPALNMHLEAGVTMENLQQLFEKVRSTNKYYFYEGIDPEATKDLIDVYLPSSAGASGAVAGLLTAFAVIYANMPLNLMFIPIPIKAKYLIGGYFALDLYRGIMGSSLSSGSESTDHWAHVLGGVIGFVMMWYWKKNSFNQHRWD